MYGWAKPGVKVVCIKSWVNRYNNEPHKTIVGPVEGQIYTIREVFFNKNFEGGPQVGVRLFEISNPIVTYGKSESPREQSFALPIFRPLIEKKLPDALTSLLTNPKKSIRKDQFDKHKEFDPV